MTADRKLLLTDAHAITDAAPVAHVLSNGGYTVLITAAGTGYSIYDGVALTRWIPDRTRDAAGYFLYVKDQTTGSLWSAGLQPVQLDPDSFSACFGPGKAEFRREDNGIATLLEICVAPDDDVELRRITLTNHTERLHSLQLTSYAEVVLNTPAGDAGHLAFSKLFVQTALSPDGTGLIAKRRPRSGEERPLWLEHRFWQVDPSGEEMECETDRARFIGRGRTLARPRAIDSGVSLSGNTGSVLDPVLAIRRSVEISPGEAVRFVAILAVSDAPDGVETLARRYSECTDGVDAIDTVDAAFAAAVERGRQLSAELGLDGDHDSDGEQNKMLSIATAIGAITYGDGTSAPLTVSAGEPIDDRIVFSAALNHA